VALLVADLIDPDIRRKPAGRSTLASTSADPRVTVAPTVRQAIRISRVTAVLEHCTANQTTVSSVAGTDKLYAEIYDADEPLPDEWVPST